MLDRLWCVSAQTLLFAYKTFEIPETINLGDGRVVEALGFGAVRLDLYFNHTKSKQAILCNVLYVPKLKCNLISVTAAASKSNIVAFDKTSCKI